MITPNEILPKLINAGNDIYYCSDVNAILPEFLEIHSKKYYRFCDLIFIPNSTDNLSSEQVKIVNRIRVDFFEKSPQFSTNSIVRQYFKQIVQNINPKILFEFGSSINPLISFAENGIEKVYLADFDTQTVETLREKGIDCLHFGLNDKLVVPNNSVDMILSVFVFQFFISENQIGELYRIMSSNGVFIANIYKRDNESKKTLAKQFTNIGFYHKILPDDRKLCNGHEYWVFTKIKWNKQLSVIENTLSKNI